ncbi:hypothetical protein EB169_09720, partial [archaeon]|nr:hypothetical protein [archaeon]
MGLFKGIGNFFKSKVGKLLTGIGAVLAAPFTAGASLAAVPFILKGGKKQKGEPVSLLSKIEEPIASVRVNIPPPQIVEPVIEKQKEVVITTADEQIEIRKITTPVKTDVTLYGFYSTINKLTIPTDNDLDNVVIVPNTFFPFIVEFTNHPPSEGIRYVSEFVFQKLLVEWETNLGKVLHTLENGLSIYPYIKFDWQTFVDKYNTFNAGVLEKEGGILYGFTVSPVFLLQWIDGPEVSNLLDYSYKIPPAVKTVFDFNPPQPEQPGRTPANVTTDPKKFDKLTKLIDTVTKVGTTFAIAKAAIGGVTSIYKNTKDSINKVSDAASKLGDKFKDLKTALSKDAINGKISDVKNLIKTKLPTPKNIFKKFKENNEELLTGWSKFRKKRAEKKLQRRLPKDQRVKTKFNLKNFNLPELPTLPNLPSIPTLPKKISLANLNQLPGFGKLPNISGLVAQGKGIVSGLGNINLKDPMSLLNAPSNILNQVSGLANNASSTLESAQQNILNSPTNKAAAEKREQVAIETQRRINETLADLKAKGDAALKKTGLDNSTLTRTVLKDRIGTIE